MTGFGAFLHSVGTALGHVVTWLKPFVTSFFGTIGDVFANRPEPAARVALYTVAPIVLGWALLKAGKKLKFIK